ncbi:MAG: hypothetical protein RSC68_20395, partial [Acinetobacter sp.]
ITAIKPLAGTLPPAPFTAFNVFSSHRSYFHQRRFEIDRVNQFIYSQNNSSCMKASPGANISKLQKRLTG